MRRTNKIKYLLKEDGGKCEDQEEIKSMARSFYTQLYSSEPHAHADHVLETIPVKINNETNEELCKPYSNEEIKEVLFQMGPTKAPGPNGFPAIFYQKH